MNYDYERRQIEQSSDSEWNKDRRLLLLKLRYGLISEADIEFGASLGDVLCRQLAPEAERTRHFGTNFNSIKHYVDRLDDKTALEYALYSAFAFVSNPHFIDEQYVRSTIKMIQNYINDSSDENYDKIWERASKLYNLIQVHHQSRIGSIYSALRRMIYLVVEYQIEGKADRTKIASLIEYTSYTPDNKFSWEKRYRHYLINR